MSAGNVLLLLLLAAMWGPSFLFIKVAVQEIPPLTMSAFRTLLGGGVLWLFLLMSRQRMPGRGPIWKHFAISGLFGQAIPFSMFAWGEIYIDSALASILNGTTPLFTIVIAHFYTSDDRLNKVKIVGTCVGFLGLAVIVAPELMKGVSVNFLGLMAVTIPSLCYGISIVYSRQTLRGLGPLVAPVGQLGVSGLMLLPVALLFDQPYNLPAPSLPAFSSLVALSLLGTCLAFIVYFHLLEHNRASHVSMVTYLVPIFGILLGVIVLNERLDSYAYLGCALILLGVMVVNGVFTNRKPEGEGSGGKIQVPPETDR